MRAPEREKGGGKRNRGRGSMLVANEAKQIMFQCHFLIFSSGFQAQFSETTCGESATRGSSMLELTGIYLVHS